MSTATNALAQLRDRAIIDDAELLRMCYRFAGEVVDVEALLARGKKAGYPSSLVHEAKTGTTAPSLLPKGEGGTGSSGKKTPLAAPAQTPGKPAGIKVNPESDDLNGMPKENQG
jgi:hypothetical protein